MLRIENISQRYGDHGVFQGLNHHFPPGCVALCEEDSTGKSSLLRIIAGITPPDTGDVWINSYSLRKTPQLAKASLAYVPNNCLEFPTQTGISLLEQAAAQKNTSVDDSIMDLAYRLGLEPHLNKRFEQMSTGTRRKVYLAAAALGDPVVILADGPSDGLDAPARAVLAEQFRLWGETRVVLFASHDPELVQACGATAIHVGSLR